MKPKVYIVSSIVYCTATPPIQGGTKGTGSFGQPCHYSTTHIYKAKRTMSRVRHLVIGFDRQLRTHMNVVINLLLLDMV